jgi:hypothetical protein
MAMIFIIEFSLGGTLSRAIHNLSHLFVYEGLRPLDIDPSVREMFGEPFSQTDDCQNSRAIQGFRKHTCIAYI